MAGIGVLNAFARASQGAADGAREVRRDEKQVEVDAYDSQIRKSNLEALPLKQEAAKLQARAEMEEAQTAIETAPARRAAEKTIADGKQKLAPGQVELAQKQQFRAIDNEIVSTVADAVKKVKTVAAAQEEVLGLAGKMLIDGDMAGLNRVMEHAIDAPIFPGLNGMGRPVKTEQAEAPAGTVGIDGKPLTGNALRVTFADGTFKYISPQMLQGAYQKRLGAEQQASIKIVKPGEAGIDTRTGKVVFERDPVGMINIGTEESPQWIKPGAGGAGVGGASSRGGKAADPGKAVAEAFEFIATKAESKLPSAVLAKGNRLAKQIFTEGGGRVPPELAAEVAFEVSNDPTKMVPAIDPRTGKIDGVYNHPEQGEFVIARGMASANNPGDLKPEQLRTLTAKMIEGQDPQIRPMLVAAAFDPKAKKALIDGMFVEYDKDVDAKAAANPQQAAAIVRAADAVKKASEAALNEKLSLIAKYSKPPKAEGAGGLKSPGGVFQGGGAAFAVDPASPAGKVQARQAAARGESEARAAAAETERQTLSKQFRADRQSMPAIELVRKYDKLRGNMPTQDAAELQKIERTL